MEMDGECGADTAGGAVEQVGRGSTSTVDGVLDLCGVGMQTNNGGSACLAAALASLEPAVLETLTDLNLSHNDLETLPPVLFHMPCLTRLDLSFNQLSTLPAEMGRLTQLQVLNVQCNPLTSLPLEMQGLTGLRKLRVSNVTKRKLATNPQLFLRYLNTMPFKPIKEELPRRRMLYLDPSNDDDEDEPDRDGAHGATATSSTTTTTTSSATTTRGMDFRVMTYNILAPSWTSSNGDHGCPEWAHKWSYRKRKVLWEVLHNRADIICFQEIEKRAYEGYFSKHLGRLGFEGVFQPPAQERPIDGFLNVGKQRNNPVGNATFFRTSLFDLVETRNLEFMHLIDQLPCGAKVNKYFRTQFRISDKQAMVLMLRVKRPITENSSPSATPEFLCLANTHIYWDPTYPSIKLMQVYLLTQAIEQTVAEWQRKEKLNAPVPVVLCGDFNSLPTSSVYNLLAQGLVKPGHQDLSAQVSSQFARDGLRQNLNLTSAYAHVLSQLDQEQADSKVSGSSDEGQKKSKRRKKNKKGRNTSLWEPAFTNFTPSFNGTLDYIWISATSPSSAPTTTTTTEAPSTARSEEEDENEAAEDLPSGKTTEGRLHVRGVLEPVNKDRVKRLHPQSRQSLLSVTFPSDHFALVCDLALS